MHLQLGGSLQVVMRTLPHDALKRQTKHLHTLRIFVALAPNIGTRENRLLNRRLV